MTRSKVMAPRFHVPSERTIALACALGVAGCAAAPTRDQEVLADWVRASGDRMPGTVRGLLGETPPPAEESTPCLTADEERGLEAGAFSDADVARLAVRCNPEIEAGLERARAALAESEARSSLPDLSLRYEASATPIREPWRLDRTAMHMVGLAQEFPLGPTRSLASRTAADEGIRLLAERAQARRDLFAMVVSDLATARAAQEQEAVLQRHIETVNRVVEFATVRYRSGRGMAEDITRFQVERGRLETAVFEIRRIRAAALARVNAALHRRVTRPLRAAEAAQGVGVTPDPAAAVGRLWENSPILEALRAEVRAAEGEAALARAEARWPSLMVGGSYNAAPRMDDSYSGMVSLNLPWLNPARLARERAASARAEAARRMLERRHDDLASRVVELVERLRQAEETDRLLRRGVLPDARVTLDLALATYRSGLGDFTGVLEAQRTLLDIEMRLVEVAARWTVNWARLRALVGDGGDDP